MAPCTAAFFHGGERMKKFISIALTLALLAGFASCKKLDGVYIEEDTTADALAADGSGEEATASAELEEFLKNFNIDTTDPSEVQQQLEQMMESEAVDVELEFGEDVIDDSNSTKVDVELKEDGKPDRGEIENSYLEMISGDTFTLDMVIKQTSADGRVVTAPVYATRDGDKLYIEMTAVDGDSSIKFAMYSAGDGNIYAIFPAMRSYILVTEEEVGDVPLGDFISEEFADAESTAVYVETRQVVYNNATYDCDIYQDGDVTTKNYYSDSELKRVETVDGDGNTTIMEFNELSKEAESSKLKKPSGYFDMTHLITSKDALEGLAS